jgi:hypothetical protein
MGFIREGIEAWREQEWQMKVYYVVAALFLIFFLYLIFRYGDPVQAGTAMLGAFWSPTNDPVLNLVIDGIIVVGVILIGAGALYLGFFLFIGLLIVMIMGGALATLATASPTGMIIAIGVSGFFVWYVVRDVLGAFSSIRYTPSKDSTSDRRSSGAPPRAKRTVDWSSLTPSVAGPRGWLEKAEHFLTTGEINQAAMCGSVALESGLKTLCERHDISIKEAEGMADIASKLKDKRVITADEYWQLRKYTSTVRNKAMHGDFESIDKPDVWTMIGFTRGFFNNYGL